MIQTTEVSITYKGDGVQTSFPYPYPYRNSDDIVGYIINDVGYEKRITNNFKYDKVSNIYQYPLAGEPLAAPYSIKLIRETPQQQNADLPGKLPFSLIEKSLDWIIMILQEIGSRCNSLWHIRNDCKLSETNARNSASAIAESEKNAANSEDMAKKWAMSPVSIDGVALQAIHRVLKSGLCIVKRRYKKRQRLQRTLRVLRQTQRPLKQMRKHRKQMRKHRKLMRKHRRQKRLCRKLMQRLLKPMLSPRKLMQVQVPLPVRLVQVRLLRVPLMHIIQRRPPLTVLNRPQNQQVSFRTLKGPQRRRMGLVVKFLNH